MSKFYVFVGENKVRNKGMEYIVGGVWKNMVELGLSILFFYFRTDSYQSGWT